MGRNTNRAESPVAARVAPAANLPGDVVAEDVILEAFMASLESAKKSGVNLIVARAADDYETFRWDEGRWVCQKIARPGATVSSIGFGS